MCNVNSNREREKRERERERESERERERREKKTRMFSFFVILFINSVLRTFSSLHCSMGNLPETSRPEPLHVNSGTKFTSAGAAPSRNLKKLVPKKKACHYLSITTNYIKP